MSKCEQLWFDPFMTQVAVSVMGNGEPVSDFLFNTSDLAALPYRYWDIFGEMIWLPVCDLEVLDDAPEHSAVLIDWLTPSVLPSDLAAGIFVSKWADLGIFRHRWGDGLCPPEYCATNRCLHIFAPRSGWDPPYLIFHTPWGDE
jgi:hypothetical protein